MEDFINPLNASPYDSTQYELDKDKQLTTDVEKEMQRRNDPTPAIGMFDADGRPTAVYNNLLSSDWAERRGITSPQADGFLKETVQGLQGGWARAKRGYAKSFGQEEKVQALERYIENSGELGKPNVPGLLHPSNVGYTIGSAGADSAVFLGVGTVLSAITFATGGGAAIPLAGGFAASFARMFGETLEDIEQSIPDASFEKILGISLSLTGIKSAAEVEFGLEPVLAKAIGKNFVLNMMKSTAGTEAIEQLGKRAVWRWGSGIGAYLKQGVAEGYEEVLQRFADDLVKNALTGERFDDFSEYYADFVNGTIGGLALSTGTMLSEIQSHNAMQNLQNPITEEQIAKFHSKFIDGTEVFDKQSKMLADAEFDKFYNGLRTRFDIETSESLTTLVRQISYNLAIYTNKNPQDFIDTFKMAFLDQELTQKDVDVLFGLRGDQEKTMVYLNKTFNLRKHINETVIDNVAKDIVELTAKQQKTGMPLTKEERTGIESKHLALLDKWQEEAKAKEEALMENRKAEQKTTTETSVTPEDNLIVTPEEAIAETRIPTGPVVLNDKPSIQEYVGLYTEPIVNEDGWIIRVDRRGNVVADPPLVVGEMNAKGGLVKRVLQPHLLPDADLSIESGFVTGTEADARKALALRQSVLTEGIKERKIEADYLVSRDDIKPDDVYIEWMEEKERSNKVYQWSQGMLDAKRKAEQAKEAKRQRMKKARESKIPKAVVQKARAGDSMARSILRRDIEDATVATPIDPELKDKKPLWDIVIVDNIPQTQKDITDETIITTEPFISSSRPSFRFKMTNLESQYINELVNNKANFDELKDAVPTFKIEDDNIVLGSEEDVSKLDDFFDEAVRRAEDRRTIPPRFRKGIFGLINKVEPVRFQAKLSYEQFSANIVREVEKQVNEYRLANPDSGLIASIEDDAGIIKDILSDPDQAFKEAVELRRRLERFGLSELVGIMLMEYNQKSLFQSAEQIQQFQSYKKNVEETVKAKDAITGQYLSEYQLAVFYSEADAGTVMHEWMHHLMGQSLLPEEYVVALKKRFNNGKAVWDGRAMEEATDAFISYIRHEKLPADAPDKLVSAFEYIKKVFAGTYDEVKQLATEQNTEISDDVKKLFDKAFGVVATEDALSLIHADTLHESTKLGPMANAKAVFQSRVTMPRNKKITALHGIFGSHDKVRQSAFEKFGEGNIEDFSLNDLTDAQISELYNEAKTTGADIVNEVLNPEQFLLNKYNVNSKNELDPAEQINFESDLEWLTKGTDNRFLDDFDTQVVHDELVNFMESLPVSESLRAKEGKGSFVAQRFKNKIKDWGRRFTYYFSSPARLFYYFGGNKYGTIWDDTLGNAIKAGIKKTEEINLSDEKLFMQLKNKYKASFENFHKKVILGGVEWTLGEAISISAMTRDAQQKQTLIDSNPDVTEAVISDANKLMNATPSAKAVIQVLDDFYKTKYEQADPVHMLLNDGKHLSKVPYYIPMTRKNGAYTDHDLINEMLTSEIKRADRQKGEQIESWQKSRTGGRGAEIDILDPMRQAIAYGHSVNNYTAKAKTIRQLLKVIDTSRFKNAMADAYGQDMKAWNILNDTLVKELAPTGRLTPMNDAELVARRLRTNTQAALLSFRLTTPPKQVLSLSNALAIIPGGIENIFRAFSNGNSVLTQMVSNSYRKDGPHKQGKHILEGHKVYQLWQKYSPELITRHGGEAEIQELSSRGPQSAFGRIKIGGKSVFELGLVGIKNFDAWTVATSWLTAFDSALEVNMRRGDEYMTAERKAAWFADSVIDRTQPQSTVHLRSMAQTQNEFVKGLIPFSGLTLNNFQEWQTMLSGLLDVFSKEGGASVAKAIFKGNRFEYDTPVIQKIMYASVIPAVLLGVIIRRRLPDEDEMINDVLAYPLMSLPIIGPALGQTIMSGFSDPTLSPIYLEVANNFLSATADIISGDVDITGKTGQSLLRLFAESQGLPEVMFQVAREMVDAMVRGEDISTMTPQDFLTIMQAKVKEREE